MRGQQGLFEGHLSRYPIKGREGASKGAGRVSSTGSNRSKAMSALHTGLLLGLGGSPRDTSVFPTQTPHDLFHATQPCHQRDLAGLGGILVENNHKTHGYPFLWGLIFPVGGGHTSVTLGGPWGSIALFSQQCVYF